MSHARVAVLRGGPSEEYQISMRTGATVLAALTEAGYHAKDVIITRSGDWLEAGLQRSPENILKAVDVVFVALHGAYGEDGEVQKILQRARIPFTGSRSFPSAIAFNKATTKKVLRDFGIRTPKYREVSYDSEQEVVTIAESIIKDFGPEYIIKPLASGSSLGVSVVPIGGDLTRVLAQALQKHTRVLVEEFIRGKEATVGTLEQFRNDPVYVFPAIEIITPNDVQFFDTDSKYNGKTQEICPARFSYEERSELAAMAAQAHTALDLSQYSRSDFIIARDGIYFLEINTLPGLTPESLYPKAASAVGLDFTRLVVHLVETATC